jgi:hypothetical protein
MVLKKAFVAASSAALLVWSGLSMADEYAPDEFLNLDLSEALFSPKALGPQSSFAPVAVEAKSDRPSEVAQAPAESKAEANIVIHKRVAHLRRENPHGMARTKSSRRPSNPLDAHAFDARVQVWPCRSGGICSWKRN